jgi:hypothetical protein
LALCPVVVIPIKSAGLQIHDSTKPIQLYIHLRRRSKRALHVIPTLATGPSREGKQVRSDRTKTLFHQSQSDMQSLAGAP